MVAAIFRVTSELTVTNHNWNLAFSMVVLCKITHDLCVGRLHSLSSGFSGSYISYLSRIHCCHLVPNCHRHRHCFTVSFLLFRTNHIELSSTNYFTTNIPLNGLAVNRFTIRHGKNIQQRHWWWTTKNLNMTQKMVVQLREICYFSSNTTCKTNVHSIEHLVTVSFFF